MAAELDISKRSTCHDVHDDHVREHYHKSKRRCWRSGKKSDDCGKVEYESDADMTPVRHDIKSA